MNKTTNKNIPDGPKTSWYKKWWVLVIVLCIVVLVVSIVLQKSATSNLTRADQSSYNQNPSLATTSLGLSRADLAWHAVNSYSWDCPEVLDVGSNSGSYYIITCANGTKLRVYPHLAGRPHITDLNGRY